MPRYAIFFSPLAGATLNAAAARWLGRDVFTGEMVERPSMVEGLSLEQFDKLTAAPRRYGFHGTLKAPFELAEGKKIEALEEELESYCSRLTPFDLPLFKVGQLGHFFALLPSAPCDRLKDLATSLVMDFDSYRAPLSEFDIARRNPEKLSQSQRENLMQWGYPYIRDDFRFHMTLTAPVPEAWTASFQQALDLHFVSHIAVPQPVNALSIYEESERGAAFRMRRQIMIGG